MRSGLNSGRVLGRANLARDGLKFIGPQLMETDAQPLRSLQSREKDNTGTNTGKKSVVLLGRQAVVVRKVPWRRRSLRSPKRMSRILTEPAGQLH